MSDTESLDPLARLRDRFHGTLIGLAVADALATPSQWARPDRSAPIRDLCGGGPHDLPRGAWRADTAMAWCIASSLVEQGRYDAADELERLRRWQRDGAYSASGECIGISAAVSHVITHGAPSTTLADGFDAVVRAAPITLFHFAAPAMRDAALESATALIAHEGETHASVQMIAQALQAALQGNWEEALAALPTQGRCAPLRELLLAQNWKDAALAAANLGGEAQGLPALVGALAGARDGLSAIPLVWRESIAHADELRELADQLLVGALVELAGEV